MNEKRNVLVVKFDESQEKPSLLKITFISTSPEIKKTSDAFAVDWQLETSSASSENNFSALRHKIAAGITNGRERHSISFVPPRLKPSK
jgi:hypothetical protein